MPVDVHAAASMRAYCSYDRAIAWQLIAELEVSLAQANGDAAQVCKGPGASTIRDAAVYRASAAQVHEGSENSHTHVRVSSADSTPS
jgi:hypothetical protein